MRVVRPLSGLCGLSGDCPGWPGDCPGCPAGCPETVRVVRAEGPGLGLCGLSETVRVVRVVRRLSGCWRVVRRLARRLCGQCANLSELAGDCPGCRVVRNLELAGDCARLCRVVRAVPVVRGWPANCAGCAGCPAYQNLSGVVRRLCGLSGQWPRLSRPCSRCSRPFLANGAAADRPAISQNLGYLYGSISQVGQIG